MQPTGRRKNLAMQVYIVAHSGAFSLPIRHLSLSRETAHLGGVVADETMQMSHSVFTIQVHGQLASETTKQRVVKQVPRGGEIKKTTNLTTDGVQQNGGHSPVYWKQIGIDDALLGNEKGKKKVLTWRWRAGCE
jgi:hypothetical protein